MISVTFNYARYNIGVNVGEDTSLVTIFEKLKENLGYEGPPSDYIFYLKNEIVEIGHQPIKALPLRQGMNPIVILKKTDLAVINNYLTNYFPSLFYESLHAPKGKVDMLAQIMTINALFKEISNPSFKSQVLAIVPKSISDKLDPLVRLTRLAQWFHDNFYTHYETPKCKYCHTITKFIGAGNPCVSERPGDPLIAEIYCCPRCDAHTRLPRNRNPLFILKNPTGRITEACVCFGLILTQLGYSIRFVDNHTNSLCIEAWIETENRFVHVDPSEGVTDCPLLYEAGWGSEITAVTAISDKECVDVTLRYVSNHEELIARREAIGGYDWLGKMISYWNKMWARGDQTVFARQGSDSRSMRNARKPRGGELRKRSSPVGPFDRLY